MLKEKMLSSFLPVYVILHFLYKLFITELLEFKLIIFHIYPIVYCVNDNLFCPFSTSITTYSRP